MGRVKSTQETSMETYTEEIQTQKTPQQLKVKERKPLSSWNPLYG